MIDWLERKALVLVIAGGVAGYIGMAIGHIPTFVTGVILAAVGGVLGIRHFID